MAVGFTVVESNDRCSDPCAIGAVFGLVLQGPWNHAFYLLLDAALPPTPDPVTLVTLEKVGIDQFIQA